MKKMHKKNWVENINRYVLVIVLHLSFCAFYLGYRIQKNRGFFKNVLTCFEECLILDYKI